MATQGIVSIVDETGKTALKAIAGCDGYNAEDLASAVKACPVGSVTADSLYSLATSLGFGCKDCLVVMDKDKAVGTVEDLPQRYRETFEQPEFNPRWKFGTADHVFVV